MQTKIEITYHSSEHPLILKAAYALVLSFELAGKLAVILSPNNLTYDSSKEADVLIILKKARAKRK